MVVGVKKVINFSNCFCQG